jgi:hypothetical protein
MNLITTTDKLEQLRKNVRLIISGVKETGSGLIEVTNTSNYDDITRMMAPFESVITELKALQTFIDAHKNK